MPPQRSGSTGRSNSSSWAGIEAAPVDVGRRGQGLDPPEGRRGRPVDRCNGGQVFGSRAFHVVVDDLEADARRGCDPQTACTRPPSTTTATTVGPALQAFSQAASAGAASTIRASAAATIQSASANVPASWRSADSTGGDRHKATRRRRASRRVKPGCSTGPARDFARACAGSVRSRSMVASGPEFARLRPPLSPHGHANVRTGTCRGW